MSAAVDFALPPRLEAHEPPEARGLARDGVRLMVASRSTGDLVHARFSDLPELLDPGDLLVVNTSATLPAALPARRPSGAAVELRLSTPARDRDPERWWIVELRDADDPLRDPRLGGETLTLPGGGRADIVAPFAAGVRLWLARLSIRGALQAYLAQHGRPIRYRYVPDRWPLSAYQTAYASEPGSAEMASAGRPFTPELLTAVMVRGVHVAPVTLHAGVSSPERHEPPYPERFSVPEATARLVNAVRYWGGRVVAVGTTVVRALESAAESDGAVVPDEGETSLVIGPERGLRAIDGILTGWHEPHASHLDLLRTVGGDELLDRAYRAALDEGYLWHEFGDSHLILP